MLRSSTIFFAIISMQVWMYAQTPESTAKSTLDTTVQLEQNRLNVVKFDPEGQNFEKSDSLNSTSDTIVTLKQNRLNVVKLDPEVEKLDKNISLDTLRRTAAAGTGSYFMGVALNYSLIGILFGADPSHDAFVGLTIGVLGTHVFKLVGPPVACVQSSKADDLYKNRLSSPKNNSWTFYTLGWIFEVGEMICGITSTNNSSEGLIITTVSFAVARDILWGIACISSVSHIKKVKRLENQGNVSLYPVFSSTGQAGLSISYRF